MRGTRAGALMAVGVLMSAVGCAEKPEGLAEKPAEKPAKALVIKGKAPAAPYSGPLWVALEETDEEESPQNLPKRSGAAGRALECEGRIYSGGGADRWSEGDGGDTPEGGLRAYFDIEQPEEPRYGYRVEREEAERVLYSFDVGGRTKVAVVVAKGGPNRPGWGPETSASCDPAELPAEFTDTKAYEIWSDRSGKRVPVSEVSSSAGSAHCDWQKAYFLETGEYEQRRLYARDPEGVLPAEMLTSGYDGDAAMPAAARDTGFRLDGRELWLTKDASKAYVCNAGSVEVWPAVKKGMGCD
ncbi:hypothetical protein [Streptomyces jumonjinensis]|uniref:hypothetical protein n=1 Tax=Streptomyces jumonjinensis TaxID=1945 RepID=UPI0037A991D6